MDNQDSPGRLQASGMMIEKRLEVMRKQSETSLLQNEIICLESELRQLELQHEGAKMREQTSKQRPRRVLPEKPRGRRAHITPDEPVR